MKGEDRSLYIPKESPRFEEKCETFILKNPLGNFKHPKMIKGVHGVLKDGFPQCLLLGNHDTQA